METLIEILIDNSNSMGPLEADKVKNITYLLPDGSTRMELAKKILVEEIIPKLDYATKVRVRKFHSITKADKTSEPLIDPVYNGTLDKATIIAKINAIEIPKNTGGTPITAAVKSSINELAKTPNADRKIILVTDGQETDGGDYKKTAEEALKQLGIPCNIFIVGISQDKDAEEKSKALANSTGGTYVNLKAKVYDKPTLQTALRPIYFKAVAASLQNIAAENPKPIQQPLPIQQQNVQNSSTIPVAEPKPESTYSEVIQKNTIAFNLIAKQLTTITEAIEEIKNVKKNDEEVEINENTELNERVRIASESFLYNKLKEKFGSRVKWLNEANESGSIYDFEVIDTLDNSKEYYIECKASMFGDKVFLMTKSEWLFFLQNKSKYQLYFIAPALTNPTVIKIENFMEWLIQGKVIPLSTKNVKLKADRIVFTILD